MTSNEEGIVEKVQKGVQATAEGVQVTGQKVADEAQNQAEKLEDKSQPPAEEKEKNLWEKTVDTAKIIGDKANRAIGAAIEEVKK